MALRLPRLRPQIPVVLHAPIRGGAWFFVAWSLASLAWAVLVMLRDPATLAAIWQTDAPDGSVVRAVGLTYGGPAGALLACAELAIVLVAVAASCWGRARGRLLGHGVLVAWAMLWLLNLVGLAWVDHQIVSVAQATVMSGLFACVVGRACLAKPRTQPERPEAPNAHETPKPVVAVRHEAPASTGTAEPTSMRRRGHALRRAARHAWHGAARLVERARQTVGRLPERQAARPTAHGR